MTDPVFVDTNVLVYARDDSEPRKKSRAAKWMKHLWSAQRGRASFQVLLEFYVTVTRKLSPGLPVEQARKDVNNLLAWHPVPVDSAVLEAGWRVQDKYGISWCDSLIVAAAQVSGSKFLLSEDLQEGQDFDGVVVVNPFSTDPPEEDGGEPE